MMEGAHVIEVNDLVNFMKSRSNTKKNQFPLLRRIRRAPCDADLDIYQPCVVSIGPYHHKTDATLEMEKVKWECFGYILKLNPEKKMRDYMEAIAGLEQQMRSCYANEINTDSDEFLKMMLLDACLMICILHGVEEPAQLTPNFNFLNMDARYIGLEQNIHTPAICCNDDASQQISMGIIDYDNATDNTNSLRQWYTCFFAHDLLLLENQIPLFAIVKMYELITNGGIPITVLLDNVSRFMEDILLPYPKAVLEFDQLKEVHHFLHLCHQYFKPNHVEITSELTVLSNLDSTDCYENEAQIVDRGKELLGWHQASEYRKAGIELKKQEFSANNPQPLLDIRFSKNVLEVPCLTVDPNTHCLFRNLLSFEETCPQFGNYITTYVMFLSEFISTPEDVSLLTKRGIIAHQLNSDAEVSNIFKMLAEGVNFDINSDHYLNHIFHEMEVHYQMKRPRWRGWFDSISSKLPG